jgi:hypothetical protein
MKFSRLLLLLVIPFLVAACGPTAQERADYAAIGRSGVSGATYDKMVHGDPLSLVDIENLSHAQVNDGITLRYLRNTGTVYTLNSADVINLRRSGVSQSVIDYMLQSAREYYNYPPIYDPYFGPWWGPWYGPGFYGSPFFLDYRGGGHHHHH